MWRVREEEQVDLEAGRVPGGQYEGTWVCAGGRCEEERQRAARGATRSPPSGFADWPGFPCLPPEINPPFMLFKYLQVEGGRDGGGWGIFLNGCRVGPAVGWGRCSEA